MNALQAVGLGIALILAGMAMAISIARWPLGVAVGLAGLALLFFGGLFGRMGGETKPPSPPA
jgi:predicted cobalt transporter CbtA